MLKKRDNAIKDIEAQEVLEEIINAAESCTVGMVDGDKPYVLGFNFGYADKTIYLHCGKEGKKIDVLKNNPNVCVYFSTNHELFARHEQVACSWRMRYKSVQCNGKAEFVEDYDQKLKALNVFMKHYTPKDFCFNKPAVDNILIIKIIIESWTGRSFEC